MQVKATIKFCFTLIRIAKTKENYNTIADRDMGKRYSQILLGTNTMYYCPFGKVTCKFYAKFKIYNMLLDPTIPTS